MVLEPDSIGINLAACNDSVTMDLVIHNKGEGLLEFSIPEMDSSHGNPTIFYDDFEDGDISDWVISHGELTSELSFDNPASGEYSLKLSGYSSGVLSRGFPTDTCAYISFYVRYDNPSVYGGGILIGYNPIAEFFRMEINAGMLEINYDSSSTSIDPDTWYFYEIKKIN